jgi:hypothetical protein
MTDEANRCWCGSLMKGKPHNCIGTRDRIEGLLRENAKLRTEAKLCLEAVDRSNAALIEAIDDMQKLTTATRQNAAMRRALTDVMQFSSDKRSKEVARGILEAHGGPDRECMVNPPKEIGTLAQWDEEERREERESKKPTRDKCQVCNGEKGGVPGNENIVDGVIMCDYCDAERSK